MPSDTPLAGEPGSRRVGAGMGLGSPSQQKAVPPRSARHAVEEGLREIEGSARGTTQPPAHAAPEHLLTRVAILQAVHADRSSASPLVSPEMAAYERTLINEVCGTLTSRV